MSVDVIKQELLSKLKQEHCFWSYNEDSIKDIPDDMLIEKTLLHLDLEEINQLFLVYPFKKIKHRFESVFPVGVSVAECTLSGNHLLVL